MAAALGLLLTVSAAKPDLVTGAVWGAVLGIGFVGATAVIAGAYEGRKMVVTALFAGYELVALIVMGAMLGAIR